MEAVAGEAHARRVRRTWLRRFVPIPLIWIVGGIVHAQDLTPRAYLITPKGSNAVTLSYSFSTGSVFTDSTLPITDFKARFHAQVFSYYTTLLGRPTPPTPGEVDGWVFSGLDLLNIRIGFESSLEYFNRVTGFHS